MPLRARVFCSAVVLAYTLFIFLGPRKSDAVDAHNQGQVCTACHTDFRVCGTIFNDQNAAAGRAGIPVSLIARDGEEIPVGITNASGNIASTSVRPGRFLIRAGAKLSRTWHSFPGQGSCNSCHVEGGNSTQIRNRRFPASHTRILSDNSCTHCHHFPASMSYAALATDGVLSVDPQPPAPPQSQVEIIGKVYPFDPGPGQIQTVRPEIFAPGYFSMFDVILAVARANGITIDYSYDESRKTHFISKINGAAADYWYHFSYDTGGGNRNELAFRRANRWDELLWRPGVWIQVVRGENEDLAGIKAEYLEEIQRETAQGHVIPSIRFNIAPSAYQGDPPGSGRLRYQREFQDVQITAHNTRSIGYPSPYSKPFQPGVVTSLDILYSLEDQGILDLVTTVHFSQFAGNYIDSQYVVALGFPGVGTAHHSGRQGFTYTTENGSLNALPNGADRKLHVTSDILVIHAPDFSNWQWTQLGNPHYEGTQPAATLPGVRLRLPLPAGQNGLQTGVAVVNEGAGASAVIWTAHEDDGSPMPVDAPGVNPSRVVVPRGGQLARLVFQLFGGNLRTPGGWLEILAEDAGTSCFFLVFDPAVAMLDGVDVSDRRAAQFLFPDIPGNQEVSISLIHPGDPQQAADVTIHLRDDQGKELGSPAQTKIPPQGRYEGRLRDLYSAASLASAGYVEITSSEPLVAVQQLGIPGVHTAMLNATDLAGGARQLYAPQFVMGGGFKSVVSLVNLEDAPTTVTLTWVDAQGAPIGQAAQRNLDRKERLVIADPGIFNVAPGSNLVEGYLSVVSSATRITGSVRFGDPGEAQFQTALPLVSEGRLEVLFSQVAQDATYFTGIAVVNANAQPVKVTVEVFDSLGNRVGTGERTIPANGRISELLMQIINNLPAMSSGYFKARADLPIVSFAVFGTHNLSALAAIPPQLPSGTVP